MMRLFFCEGGGRVSIIQCHLCDNVSAITFDRNHMAINKLRINMAPRGTVVMRLRQHIFNQVSNDTTLFR